MHILNITKFNIVTKISASLLFLIPNITIADVMNGINAYMRKDYQSANQELAPSALEGNSAAQYFYGEMHLEGKGLSKDINAGIGWIRLSAEQGNYLALIRLADFYYHGYGVQKNNVLALAHADIAIKLMQKTNSNPVKISYLPPAINLHNQITGQLNQMQIDEALRLSSNWQIGTSLPYSTTTWIPKSKNRHR